MFRDIFDPTGEYCRRLKKDCNAHYCWEKLKRGELDMERVRCWMKLDELMEKERQEKDSISRRAGVLSLMLHSTFNHEVMEKVIKMQKSGGGGGGGPGGVTGGVGGAPGGVSGGGGGQAQGGVPQPAAAKREDILVKNSCQVVTKA